MLDLLRRVTEERHHLKTLLTDEELRRPHHWGSEPFEWTIEDPAREVALHAQDPRSSRVTLCLGLYQEAVNDTLLDMGARGIIARFARAFIGSFGGGVRRLGVPLRDVEAEVLWILRGILVSLDSPHEKHERGDFEKYCYWTVIRELRTWNCRRRMSVAVPRRIARNSTESMTASIQRLRGFSN
jgi:hypothetical protein